MRACGAQVVRFRSSECKPLLWTSDSSLVCFAPRGIGTDIPVSVGVPNGVQSVWRTDDLFTYDRPQIRQLSADTNDAFTYNFEGGEILTVYGTNFDITATTLLGKRPGRAYNDYDDWRLLYDCGVAGTFYINTTMSPDTCYEPPKTCRGGADNGKPCTGDSLVGDSCAVGGLCMADWCSTPDWWGARRDLATSPTHCDGRVKQECGGGVVACDPCSLLCPPNWYTKYASAHKICSVELLKCELPAEGGRFNVMVALASQVR